MDVIFSASELCAAAAPIVRGQVRRLAGHHRLQVCDRQDLEQTLYLDLLAGWNAAGPAVFAVSESAANGPSGGRLAAALHAYLTREADRLAGPVTSSRPFRGLARPNPARPLTPSLVAALSARRPDGTAAHDLRMDVAAALIRLPDDLREACDQLIDSHVHLAPSTPVALTTADRATLCALFASLGLHHYL